MMKLRFEKSNDQRPEWKRIFANQAKEFCLSTGLHGYKYIAQSHRSVVERTIWAIGVIVSLCCALVLMHFAWEYNASRPTLTVIESTHYGIWNYWFPAVTVCDLNRISLSRTKKFVDGLKIPNSKSKEEIISELKLLNELLDPGVFGKDVISNLTELQKLFEINNLNISQVMRLVTRDCSEMLVKCKWKGDIKNCDSLFEPALSRDGLCCSFNYVGVISQESLSTCPPESNTKSCSKTIKNPKRVTACGYQTGLTVLINPATEDYHASLLAAYGVKMMLHDPHDFPDRNAENKLIGIGSEVFVSVTPVITYSTDDVKRLTISKRKCIFADEFDKQEHRGSAFRRYSYHNCLAVCRLRNVIEKCGCIPYYHEDIRYQYYNRSANGTKLVEKICDLMDLECVYFYRNYYETSWPGENITSRNLPTRITTESFQRPCNCMPDCDMFRYPLESSTGIFDRNNSYHDLDFYDNVLIKDHSVLHVFFSDLVSTQYRRDVYYNWHNLFASFGGLLGLFAGFSLMSGFELIYFFSIRLIADLCTGSKKGRI